MFQIPGSNAAGATEAVDVKDNDSPKTNYLTIDPDSGNNVRRLWSATTPQPAATQSPMAKMPGAIGADADKSTPNPRSVAEEDVLQYSSPTASRDAQGKTVPKYRLGIGQRILGTLTNFANGFAGKGANPIYVGPGALNNRYYQDERERQQNLAGAKLRYSTLTKEPAEEPQQPEQTSPTDTPPELNNNISPVNPAARERTSGGNVRNNRGQIDWRTVAQNPITGKWVGRTYGGQRMEVPGPKWMVPATPINQEDEEDREGEQ